MSDTRIVLSETRKGLWVVYTSLVLAAVFAFLAPLQKLDAVQTNLSQRIDDTRRDVRISASDFRDFLKIYSVERLEDVRMRASERARMQAEINDLKAQVQNARANIANIIHWMGAKQIPFTKGKN